MKRKIRVWAGSNQDTGVQYYRINQPSRHMAYQGLVNLHTMPFYGQHADQYTSPEFMEYFELEAKWADILFTTIGSDRWYLSLIMGMRDFGKCKLVVDIDDDFLSTHTEPNNPAYAAYLDPQSRHAEYAQYCIMQADLVTVSTEYLKRKYEYLNKNIVVIKNAIDLDKFFNHKHKSDDITIGYAGSGSHQKDWEMIEPILRKMKDKHGAKIKMIGPMQTTVVDEQIKWVEMLKYPEQLASMGFTIGVAPVRDSLMNRAKSNLRWLEYSAYKIPTVASNVVPFRDTKNILLATEPEEWEENIERLILEKNFRTKLGKSAYNEAKDNYDPNKQSRVLYDAIDNLWS